MKAIIPVAGIGTRLRPHTHTAPKVLLPVAGKPILGHILDELLGFGLTEVTFIVGYRGEMIREYIKDNFSFKANYVEQPEMLGLGHAIWLAKSLYAGESDPLLIVLGDTVFNADLHPVLAGDCSAIGVKEVDDPTRFGIVELEDGKIKRMVEKPKNPPSNLAVVGIYFLKDPNPLFECLDELIANDQRTAGEYQVTDAFQMMIDRGHALKPFFIDGWFDCGKPETLLETNEALLQLKHADDSYRRVYPGSIINPPVSIADSAEVENSIIGPNVTIAEHSVIKDSLIANSIVSKNSSVSSMVLDSSIISENAKISGHSLSLNVGDSSEITFK